MSSSVPLQRIDGTATDIGEPRGTPGGTEKHEPFEPVYSAVRFLSLVGEADDGFSLQHSARVRCRELSITRVFYLCGCQSAAMARDYNRRETLKYIGGAAAVTGLAGCTGGSSESDDDGSDGSSDGDDGYTIGVQAAGLGNAWFQSLARGVEWYAEANGLSVNIADGELDPTTQLEVAQNLINSDIDALVLNPTDTEALAEPAEQAAEQGIPTFTFNSTAASDDVKMYTAFGNFSAGQRAAEEAVAALEEQTGAREGNLVEVMIRQTTALGVDRHEGTVAGIEQYDDVDIVGEIVTENTRQDTAEKVSNFLQSNPDVDGFVGHALTVGSGIVNALDRRDELVPKGNDGHRVISHIDAGPDNLSDIRDGFVDVAVDQPVHFYGPITLHYIQEYLDAGEDDSVLPAVGDTVEGGDISFDPTAAEDAVGQNVWGEDTWAPAEVQDAPPADHPWFRTNSVSVTSENVDSSSLWGNWIMDAN